MSRKNASPAGSPTESNTPPANKKKTPKSRQPAAPKPAPAVPPALPKAERMAPPKSGVTVRMYRTGLGDCFLLALPRKKTHANGRDAFYILIDCGVFKAASTGPVGTAGESMSASDWIRAIAEDIRVSTGDRIDVLVITHEHWDHVSGFHTSQAQDVFDKITFDALWMAWTENPRDSLGRKLKGEGDAEHAALAQAMAGMKSRGMKAGEESGLVGKVLGFFGASKTFSKNTGAAMDWIKGKVAEASKSYLKPGQPPIELDGVEGARVYVLGPPHDERLIKLLDRTGTTYRMGIGWPLAAACFVAFGVVPPTDGDVPSQDELDEAREMSVPFDAIHQIKADRVRKSTAAARKDWKPGKDPADDPFFHKYYLSADDRRRIDEDWAEPTGAFALQLDSKTNNTSLAFALEIGDPGEGDVFLFPGDAQIGNWLSWFGPVAFRGETKPIGEALSWEVGGKTVTAEDLLRRAVFYKVGHHGSHNATLKQRDGLPSGLQLMGSEDGKGKLVAMVPVDEFVARNKAGYGDMPLSGIVEDLLRRTGGRVTRNDEDATPDAADTPALARVGFPADVPEMLEKFPGKTKNGLYIECTFH